MKAYSLEFLILAPFNKYQNNRIIQTCFAFTVQRLEYCSAQGL